MDLGAGEPASAGRSLTAAARRPTPVAAETLAALGSGLGPFPLIVPGVYLWAHWLLAAPAGASAGVTPQAQSRP